MRAVFYNEVTINLLVIFQTARIDDVHNVTEHKAAFEFKSVQETLCIKPVTFTIRSTTIESECSLHDSDTLQNLPSDSMGHITSLDGEILHCLFLLALPSRRESLDFSLAVQNIAFRLGWIVRFFITFSPFFSVISKRRDLQLRHGRPRPHSQPSSQPACLPHW